jgi:hypothetical protein
LTVTRSASQKFSDVCRRTIEHAQHNIVMEELSKTDQRETDRGGNEILKVGAQLRVLEPAHDVETFGVENTRLRAASVVSQHNRHALDKGLDQALVCSPDIGQLVEILLNVALTAKHGKNAGITTSSSGKKSRLRRNGLLLGQGVIILEDDESLEICLDDDSPRVCIQVTGNRMHIIGLEVLGTEMQESSTGNRQELGLGRSSCCAKIHESCCQLNLGGVDVFCLVRELFLELLGRYPNVGRDEDGNLGLLLAHRERAQDLMLLVVHSVYKSRQGCMRIVVVERKEYEREERR